MKTKPAKKSLKHEAVHIFSTSEIVRTFTEWERRYRKNPEKFQSEAEKLLKETPQSYGEACAPYFLKIKQEICGEVKCL